MIVSGLFVDLLLVLVNCGQGLFAGLLSGFFTL
jgi:hypothetical protein